MTGQLRTGWAVQDATGDRKEPWRQDAQLLRIIFGIRRVASAPGQHAAGLWLETELMAPRHSVSVTAVVVRSDGRILVIKRVDDGRWVPPGGVLELDETPQDGLVREVLEETGYMVEPERLTGVYKNMRLGVVSLVFRCRLIGGAAHTSDESQAVRWMTADKVQEYVPEARSVRVLDSLTGDGGWRAFTTANT